MRGAFVGVGSMLVALGVAACDSNDNPMSPSGNAAEVRIVANDGSQSFTPNPAQVGGQMVVWRNTHGQTHRIMANDGSFDTGNISPGGASGAVTIPASGLNYHCSIHPTMVGAIGGSGGQPPPPCAIYCE